MTSRWYLRPRAASKDVRVRAICFPPAGAGASTYVPWQRSLPSFIEVLAVQLPARGTRMRDPPIEDVSSLLDVLVPELLPELDRPYFFFGHSMGTIIMFELARELRRRSARLPSRMFVAACVAPAKAGSLAVLGDRRVHELSEPELLDHLYQLGAKHTRTLMADAEMRALLLPIVRADHEILGRYRYRTEPPLPCPITAFAGEADPIAPPDVVSEWSSETSAGFELFTRPGGHFFVEDDVAFLHRELITRAEAVDRS
jgi:medium-chain acyl-[acyl-carrier-protein] hydrolase